MNKLNLAIRKMITIVPAALTLGLGLSSTACTAPEPTPLSDSEILIDSEAAAEIENMLPGAMDVELAKDEKGAPVVNVRMSNGIQCKASIDKVVVPNSGKSAGTHETFRLSEPPIIDCR